MYIYIVYTQTHAKIYVDLVFVIHKKLYIYIIIYIKLDDKMYIS